MLIEKQHLTAQEFDRFVHLPENADQAFELIAGEIVEMVSNNYSSELGMLIGSLLNVFVRQNKLGRVTGADGGYIISGERYIPDVAFITFARQPEACHEAYNPNPPDLAVEVLSPSDNLNKLRVKISNYLAAGTIVWLVLPEDRVIEVHAPGQPVKILGLKDTVDGGLLLPGFTLDLRDIFAE
jgi:Uma2 family endonuclease